MIRRTRCYGKLTLTKNFDPAILDTIIRKNIPCGYDVRKFIHKYVVAAFCGDTDDQFYHFNKKDKSEGITLNHDVYVALVKYKSVFEKQNYYEWKPEME